MFCALGSYSLNNAPIDVYMAGFFGLLGYVLAKFDCEPAPLLLGFVLGPMMEENLRRALLISRGDPSVLITHPISAAFLGLATLSLLAFVIAPGLHKRRQQLFSENAGQEAV
jgi:TctA family transporter